MGLQKQCLLILDHRIIDECSSTEPGMNCAGGNATFQDDLLYVAHEFQ